MTGKSNGVHMKNSLFDRFRINFVVEFIGCYVTMFWSRGNSGHTERSAIEWMNEYQLFIHKTRYYRLNGTRKCRTNTYLFSMLSISLASSLSLSLTHLHTRTHTHIGCLFCVYNRLLIRAHVCRSAFHSVGV